MAHSIPPPAPEAPSAASTMLRSLAWRWQADWPPCTSLQEALEYAGLTSESMPCELRRGGCLYRMPVSALASDLSHIRGCCTSDELAAINLYTQSGAFHRNFNAALRSHDLVTLQPWEKLGRLLLSGLDKLPKRPYCRLMRCMPLRLAPDSRIVGAELNFPELLSTSQNSTYFECNADFTRATERTIIVIDDVMGIDISELSSFREAEVVIWPGLRAEVVYAKTMSEPLHVDGVVSMRTTDYLRLRVLPPSPTALGPVDEKLKEADVMAMMSATDTKTPLRELAQSAITALNDEGRHATPSVLLLWLADQFNRLRSASSQERDNPGALSFRTPHLHLHFVHAEERFLYSFAAYKQCREGKPPPLLPSTYDARVYETATLARVDQDDLGVTDFLLWLRGLQRRRIEGVLGPDSYREYLATKSGYRMRLRFDYLQGTCERIFKAVDAWSGNVASALHLSIEGQAGVGKSVFAEQLTHQCRSDSPQRLNLIGASFCRFDDALDSDIRWIIVDLACQLAECELYPTLGKHLAAAFSDQQNRSAVEYLLLHNFDVDNDTPKLFEELISLPLMSCFEARLSEPFYFLVDAFDELSSVQARLAFLTALNNMEIPDCRGILRCIFTSRPIADVQNCLRSKVDVLPWQIDEDQLADVERVIRHVFCDSLLLNPLTKEDQDQWTRKLRQLSQGVPLFVSEVRKLFLPPANSAVAFDFLLHLEVDYAEHRPLDAVYRMALDRMDRQLQDIATGDPTFLSLYRDFLSQLLSTLPALQSSVTAFQLAELTGHPLGRLPTQRNLVLERLSLLLRTHTQLSQGTALTAMDVDWYVETPHKSLIDFLGTGHVHPQLSVSAAEGHAILTRQHEQFLLVPLDFSSSAQVYLHLHGCTHAAYCVVLEDDHPCCRLAIAEWKSAMHDKKLQAINFQAVGKVLDDLGAYAKGEMFLQTAANLWRECGQWVKYLRALIALGAVQHRATHYDAAMKLFDQLSLDVVERGQADASWDATDAVRLLCSLADCCRSQRSSDAEKYINQALELAQRNSNKLLIARCLNLKGVIHQSAGQLKECLAAYESSLQLRRECLGNFNRDVAVVLNNMGSCLLESQDWQDLERCRSYLNEALDIRLRALGPQHPQVATTYHNLGRLEAQFAKIDSATAETTLLAAEGALRKALQIRRAKLQPGHNHISHTLYFLALVLKAQQKYAEALSLLQEVLEIRRASREPSHREIQVTSKAIEEISGLFAAQQLKAGQEQ